MKITQAATAHVDISDQRNHSWVVAAKKFRKTAAAYDTVAIQAAAMTPPASVRSAHKLLVSSSRKRTAVFSTLQDSMHIYLSTTAPEFLAAMKANGRAGTKAAAQFNDWWFAVRVEARKLGVPCPRDWRRLPGYPVTLPTAAGGSDLFAGKWTGTDSFGQGPFDVEIRSLGGGKYVLIGAAGQRTLLQLRDGVLMGTATVGGAKGEIEACVRVALASDGTLKESITANVFGDGGDESGDVTNTITFERKPD